MSIILESLDIEITRRCNLECVHCMLSERLCKQLKHIEHLNLTGGEPSLAVNEIRNLLHYLKNYGVSVGDFFVATNACEYCPDFLKVIDELYEYCREPSTCGLSISTDQFHQKASMLAVKMYKGKPYYNSCKEKGKLLPYEILNEGRAEKKGIGKFTIPVNKFIYDYNIKGITFSVKDNVYINAYGDVLLNCDLSYAHQAEYSLGNILNNGLDSIFMASAFSFCPFERGVVYILKAHSDAGLIPAFFEQQLFHSINKAAAALKNIRNNVICYKDRFTARKLPDDLTLEVKDIQRSDPDFLMGSSISYTSDSEGYIGDVILTLTQSQLEDRVDENAS